MKLSASFVVALAGCAAASSQQAAEVFLIPAVDSSTPPALIPSLARLLLLHRLSTDGRGLSSTDIPPGIDTERAVSILNQFGKATAPLFADEHAVPPSQLVLMLDSMNDKQMKELRKALDATPTFTIADPPASEAHKDLIEMDLRRAGAADGNRCSIQQVLNPLEECWDGKQSAIAKHDIYEDSEVLKEVAKNVQQLRLLAKSGDMHTVIIALPTTKSRGKWATEQQELRRRQAEQVISEPSQSTSQAESTVPATPAPIISAPLGRIPRCFDSLSACSEATRNCSGHGQCQDKYASGSGAGANAVCFSCHCQATKSENGSVTHWGGAACTKQDISVPFWLFAGFTVIMIGILSMSINLLFSVGEEKLPGVIGAGVSRSK